MDEPSPASRSRPGGRTERNRLAILGATFTELAESGYADLSFERVAQRAGVHKTTIYRRWATKSDLVADALKATAASTIHPPDTGNLLEDLVELGTGVAQVLEDARGRPITQLLVGSPDGDQELVAIARDFWEARFSVLRGLVDRAIERGEVPPATDRDLVLDHLVAPLYYRSIVRRDALAPQDVRRAAEVAVHAARSGLLTRE